MADTAGSNGEKGIQCGRDAHYNRQAVLFAHYREGQNRLGYLPHPKRHRKMGGSFRHAGPDPQGVGQGPGSVLSLF